MIQYDVVHLENYIDFANYCLRLNGANETYKLQT